MSIYLKNFALFLGLPLIALTIISYLGFFLPFASYIVIIFGTIIAIVQTHKAIGGRIKFGKAIGPILLVLALTELISTVFYILYWGELGYISSFLTIIVIEYLIHFFLAFSILLYTGIWYMYEKGNQPGYASIIPIYNLIALLDIAEKPRWWFFMFLIPIANIVFLIMTFDAVSKNFGKDSGFTVGLIFLGQLFMAVLGFGDAKYMGNDNPTNNHDDTDLLDAHISSPSEKF